MITWFGPIPEKCDTCDTPITTTFYDAATTDPVCNALAGRTIRGPWANMCPSCFTLGPGCGKLGPGFGQQYEKQDDGKFMKVAG